MALYKVFKRTRLCRVYKSNVVWYTKSSAFEQALKDVILTPSKLMFFHVSGSGTDKYKIGIWQHFKICNETINSFSCFEEKNVKIRDVQPSCFKE